jgi:hypothetical protein
VSEPRASTDRTLVFLVGPPAVGKMTVGRALSRLTGYPLWHNHVSIEAVLPVFDFSTPPFNRLVTSYRHEMIREAGRSDLPRLIFTYVWAFGHPREEDYVGRLKEIFEEGGGRVVFPELAATLDTRLSRNESEDRRAAKPSKRDLESSRRRLIADDEKYRLNSDGDFPFPLHLRIDNDAMPAEAVADRIIEHFGLPRVVP